ncbi:MAG: iron-containing alcohol dehydrogenase [Phycisphaeraceae bacterium]|nr:iron-containing alcohol dehydrogenase [Phycisphaeraceae bacterium]
MTFTLDIPQRCIIAGGARQQLANEAKRLVWQRPLIVTDPFHNDTGKAQELIDILAQQNIDARVYSGVINEPTTQMVDAAIAQYNDQSCDGIIGFGGGSPLDTAKTVAVLLKNPGPIQRFMGLHKVARAGAPCIAIPTTAGTGAEATKVVVITDALTDVKMMCLDRAFLPAVAIVDYELSITSPPALTAAVGVDALTHAIEAYVSRKANPYTDAIALQACQLIYNAIRTAYHTPNNTDARSAMMQGAFMAGVAFSNASVCLVHGMSRPIGACFHVPHGLSNAMLLPAITRFSLEAAPQRYLAVAQILGLKDEQALPDALQTLNTDLNMQTPATFGIDAKQWQQRIAKMAQDALASGSPANNPRVATAAQITELYQHVYS